MSTPSAHDEVRAVALVSGRVQMVGFRWWVRQQAHDLGLAGSAVNLRDGRVEVVAEGERTAVDTLLVALRDGPPSARVSDVTTRWEAPSGAGGFRLG
ncbi:MAG: acylphosphatase [Jiangellales bacterium]